MAVCYVKLFLQIASVSDRHPFENAQQRLFLTVCLVGLGFLQIVEPDQKRNAVKLHFEGIDTNCSERFGGLSYDRFSAGLRTHAQRTGINRRSRLRFR